MNCIYRKLKESITDTSFPVLPIIIEKNYCYTTAASQIVDISDLIPAALQYNQLKIEAVVKFPSLDYGVISNYVFWTRGGINLIGASRTNFSGQIDSQNVYRVSGESNTDTTIVLDGKANKVFIDANSQTGSGSVPTSLIKKANLFVESNHDAGYSYLKSLKLYNQSGATDVLIAHFVPVTVNDVGAVWEKVSDKIYYANDGSLGTV